MTGSIPALRSALLATALLVAITWMIMAPKNAYATADSCNRSSCVFVKGSGTYVEFAMGSMVVHKAWGGWYRGHLIGKLPNGQSFNYYSAIWNHRAFPCLSDGTFSCDDIQRWGINLYKPLLNNSQLCHSTQKWNGSAWVTQHTACVTIHT